MLSHPESTFRPDDDQVYAGSTLEITKYLRHQQCEMAFVEGRDISTFIRNGRRPLVDAVRSVLFRGLRTALSVSPDAMVFTSTLTLIVRKRVDAR